MFVVLEKSCADIRIRRVLGTYRHLHGDGTATAVDDLPAQQTNPFGGDENVHRIWPSHDEHLRGVAWLVRLLVRNDLDALSRATRPVPIAIGHPDKSCLF